MNGDQIRILFSNLHGKEPIHFERVNISKSRNASNSVSYSFVPVFFNNKQDLILNPQEVFIVMWLNLKLMKGNLLL